MPRRERIIRAHIERGIHSRIPACCIAFFVATWVWPSARATARWRAYWRGISKRTGGLKYIPCPDCRDVGHVVKIHWCTKRCAGQIGACLPVKASSISATRKHEAATEAWFAAKEHRSK